MLRFTGRPAGILAARILVPAVTEAADRWEAVLQKNERVLVAASTRVTAARAARRVVAAGGEVFVVTSVAEARAIAGAFDRGIFAFNLPDGSGIVLAAEMMIAARLEEIEFFHPADELIARDGHAAEVRSTSSAIDSKQVAWSAA